MLGGQDRRTKSKKGKPGWQKPSSSGQHASTQCPQGVAESMDRGHAATPYVVPQPTLSAFVFRSVTWRRHWASLCLSFPFCKRNGQWKQKDSHVEWVSLHGNPAQGTLGAAWRVSCVSWGQRKRETLRDTWLWVPHALWASCAEMTRHQGGLLPGPSPTPVLSKPAPQAQGSGCTKHSTNDHLP